MPVEGTVPRELDQIVAPPVRHVRAVCVCVISGLFIPKLEASIAYWLQGGATAEAAIEDATSALAEVAAEMVADGEELPDARSADQTAREMPYPGELVEIQLAL